MKRLLIVIVVTSLCCCDEDEPTMVVLNFSGKVLAEVPGRETRDILDRVKVDINFYLEEGQSRKLVKTVKLLTNLNGHYAYSEEVELFPYSGYAVTVNDKYYKSCLGVLSPDDLSPGHIDYQVFRSHDVVTDVIVCLASIIKINPNKIDPLSGNVLSLTKKVAIGSLTFIDDVSLQLSDKEVDYYFLSKVTSVDFNIKVKNGGQTIEEYTAQVIPEPGKTTTLSIDY